MGKIKKPDVDAKNDVPSTKKPFDKKRWREERYSNKLKVQRWEEKRKTILQRNLHKQLTREGIKIDPSSKIVKPNTASRLKEAQIEYERKKQETAQRLEEIRRSKEEKIAKRKEYQAKRAEKSRRLNQKTRKGQPLMRGKLEFLQEKIQRMVAENKL